MFQLIPHIPEMQRELKIFRDYGLIPAF